MFRDIAFDQMLDYVQSVDVEAIEIACGGYVY